MNDWIHDSQGETPVAYCTACGGELYHGDKVIRYHDYLFCDAICAEDWLLDEGILQETNASNAMDDEY